MKTVQSTSLHGCNRPEVRLSGWSGTQKHVLRTTARARVSSSTGGLKPDLCSTGFAEGPNPETFCGAYCRVSPCPVRRARGRREGRGKERACACV
jgi:hypothetical protein